MWIEFSASSGVALLVALIGTLASSLSRIVFVSLVGSWLLFLARMVIADIINSIFFIPSASVAIVSRLIAIICTEMLVSKLSSLSYFLRFSSLSTNLG